MKKESVRTIKIAVGGLVFYDGKILLCRSPKWSKKWVIPGGGMEWGESVTDTVKREIKEETGLEVEAKSIGTVRTVTDPKEFKKEGYHFLMIDVACDANSADVKLNEEHDRYKWVSIEEALKMDLLNCTRDAIVAYLEKEEHGNYLEGWKRCKADFENYRKKTESNTSYLCERSEEEVILRLLPVLDNFNLATEHVPDDERKKGWVEGVFYIKKQLEDILSQLGVTEVEAQGKVFDPMLHESIEEIEEADQEKKGVIASVVQKGYLYKGRVIRAAKVKVLR